MEIIKPLSASIVKCLSYYDVFSYPLNANEIFSSLDRNSTNVEEVTSALTRLVEDGRICHHKDFYGFGKLEGSVERRLKGNRLALEAMPNARKWSRFISGFPYVRGVFLSGSISKNVMEEDGDIDYFVVTTPGRLWLARTLLVLYKKLFLFNSHKYFCVNYFVDTNHMEIEEKNLFTATELVTLKPICGAENYAAFMEENHWVKEHFPNYPMYEKASIGDVKNGSIKRFIEGACNNGMGALLDKLCMKITVGFWKRKFNEFEKDRFDIALKSKPYVSKHHPNNYQQKVLTAFHERMAAAQV